MDYSYGLQLWPHLWTTYMVTEKVNLPSLLSCNLKSISHLLKWTGFLQHPTYGSLQVPRIWEHVPSCHKPLALPFLTPNLLSTLSLGSVKMILRAAQYTEIFPKEGKFLWTSYQNPAERGSPVCRKHWLVSFMICLTPCRLRQGDHGFLKSQSTKWAAQRFFSSAFELSSHPHLAPSFRHLRLIETLLPSLGNLQVWEQAWQGQSQSVECSAGLSGLIDG